MKDRVKAKDLFNILAEVASVAGHKKNQLTTFANEKIKLSCSDIKKGINGTRAQGYFQIGDIKISLSPKAWTFTMREFTLRMWFKNELVYEKMVKSNSTIDWKEVKLEKVVVGLHIEKEIKKFLENDFKNVLNDASSVKVKETVYN